MKTTYRILHISNNVAYKIKHGKYDNPLTNGMIAAGHTVYDYPSETLNHLTNKKEILAQRIYDAISSIVPSFVFAQCEPENLPYDVVHGIVNKMHVPVLLWTGDVRNSNAVWEAYAHAGAIILFSNMTDVNKLRALGLKADYMQVSFDQSEYKPLEIPNNNSKIVFLGNNYMQRKDLNFPLSQFRKDMCIYLSKEFPQQFEVYGTGWGSEGGIQYNQKINLVGAATSSEYENKIYQDCAIAINLSHYAYERYSSDRMFRIMASGAFCLAHRYPGIEKEFDEGVHLDTWENLAELKNKIEYWMQPENKQRRIEIAAAGCALVHTKYLWKHRFLQLTNIINNQKLTVMKKNDEWVKTLDTKNPVRNYSQNGEEGIIGQILNIIGTENKTYVDLGAGDGKYLSNTRFFDEQGFKGLKVDGSPQGATDVVKCFITVDNIVPLLKEHNVLSDFDFLSIDLDGNDSHILEAMLTGGYRPRLIVAEFNGCLPKDKSVTMEYNANHTWANDDHYGFSFEAAKNIAIRNGYRVIAQNADTNVYMLRADLLADPDADFGVTYTPTQYHAHNPNGKWIEVPVGVDMITEKAGPVEETTTTTTAEQAKTDNPVNESGNAAMNQHVNDSLTTDLKQIDLNSINGRTLYGALLFLSTEHDWHKYWNISKFTVEHILELCNAAYCKNEGIPFEISFDKRDSSTSTSMAGSGTIATDGLDTPIEDKIDIFKTPGKVLEEQPNLAAQTNTKSISAAEIERIKGKYRFGHKPRNFQEETEMRSAGMIK